MWLSVRAANCTSKVWGFTERRWVSFYSFYCDILNQLWYSEQWTQIPRVLHNILLNVTLRAVLKVAWLLANHSWISSTRCSLNVVNCRQRVWTHLRQAYCLCFVREQWTGKTTGMLWAFEVLLSLTRDLSLFQTIKPTSVDTKLPVTLHVALE